MRERVSVCVVSCGGEGRRICSSAFSRKKVEETKKEKCPVRSIAKGCSGLVLVGVYCNPARSLASLCHRLSSLHHRWVCFIFVKEGGRGRRWTIGLLDEDQAWDWVRGSYSG